MIQLSVIIVNYNVRYFLEQALFSVRKAGKGLNMEVFVVDNNSTDASCEMVEERFPEVKLIRNTVNTGFSKANNQAILQSTGKYILLLNPDTVVEEDTFRKTLDFMEKTPLCGGLGVKMLDGAGKFLPESKRALPTPSVAFYKTFGLSSLFPKSRIFGKYHLAYLDKDSTHEVEVLAGAFMMLRKEALDRTGLLDEDFFMYGEDIDLSYRLTKAGYKNYYFPGTSIIHYKGESTKKTSVNYVFVFYRAMIIFARKHFSQRHAWLFCFLISFAIYVRAGGSILIRFFKSAFLPSLDFLVIFGGVTVLRYLWERYVVFNSHYYPSLYQEFIIPSYVITWLVAVFISNGYEKPFTTGKLFRGILYGTIAILVLYALIPESYRFSRALILLGALWAFIGVVFVRLLFKLTGFRSFQLEIRRKKKLVIVGDKQEGERVLSLLSLTGKKFEFCGFVRTRHGHTLEDDPAVLGKIGDLPEFFRLRNIDEVIFCAADVSSAEIIKNMALLSEFNLEYKIAPPESLYIIGSNSIHSNGELYVIGINSIGKPSNRRNKRMFDIISSLGMFILLPFTLLVVRNRANFLVNILRVIKGSHTWVGYSRMTGDETERLPKLRKPVLTPLNISKVRHEDNAAASRINALYAKDYKIWNDAFIVWKAFSQLGNNS